jgi:hypothetical protein
MFLATGSHDIINASCHPLGHILRQQGDSDVAVTDNGACIRGNMASQHFHEGRFARAVPADKTDPFTGLDLERNTIEKRRSAEGQ